MARSLLPRDCVVVLKGSPRHRGPCPSSDLSPWNFRGLCILQTQYDNYDAPESRWRRQGTLATSQVKEGICWFARTVWENLFYSSYYSTSETRLQHKCGCMDNPHRARVGNKQLSELVMINSNGKPQPVYSRMFHWQWQFIDSDNVVGPTRLLVRTVFGGN